MEVDEPILANDLGLLLLVRVKTMLSLSVGTAALARPQAQAMVQASALPWVGKMLPCNRMATVVFVLSAYYFTRYDSSE